MIDYILSIPLFALSYVNAKFVCVLTMKSPASTVVYCVIYVASSVYGLYRSSGVPVKLFWISFIAFVVVYATKSIKRQYCYKATDPIS